MTVLFNYIMHMIDQVLLFFNLPTIRSIRYRTRLTRRISEIDTRILKTKLEREILTNNGANPRVPKPGDSRVIIPPVFMPSTSKDSIPSLVERRRARHQAEIDAAEAVAIRAESRHLEKKDSAARANLRALEELQSAKPEDMNLKGLIARISEQLTRECVLDEEKSKK